MAVLDKNSGSMNSVECPDEWYQPHPYISNEQCGCKFVKSKCDDTGQEVFSNGSTVEDRLCHCDYTKGYVYATRPKDGCVCKPRVDNCTCLKKSCANGFILSRGMT